MKREHYQEIVDREIEKAMVSMFPHGAGQTNHTRVQHWLDVIAKRAFQQGRAWALMGLMTSEDVAEHFGVSKRRANALIKHRHERFAVGMQFGNSWLVHRDELSDLAPDDKYRARET